MKLDEDESAHHPHSSSGSAAHLNKFKAAALGNKLALAVTSSQGVIIMNDNITFELCETTKKISDVLSKVFLTTDRLLLCFHVSMNDLKPQIFRLQHKPNEQSAAETCVS